MNMQIEKGSSFAYEFNPMELVVDTHDIYKKSLEISRLESVKEKSKEKLIRLEELRKIRGYIGGYELDYQIEGFDFVKLGEGEEIQLLTFLSPLIDEHETPTRLFAPGDVYSIFKYQFVDQDRERGKFELKVHEIDDSGEEFLTEDRFYTLHPIVTSIWEPYKIDKIREVLKTNPDRELIDLS